MTRTSKIICVIIVIAGIVLVYLASSFDLFPKSKFESSLRQSIQDNRGGIISIRDVTGFKWDRMDIYTPYSTYKDANGKTIDVEEGECILVFTEKGTTVSVLRYKRFYGDFADLHREGGYSPSIARFKVPGNNQSEWLKLEWAQSESPTRPVER